MITIVGLLALHAGAATPFATFAEKLRQEGTAVQIYAAGPALTKFRELGVPVIPFSQEENVAKKIADSCSHIITDIGDPYDERLQIALQEYPIKRMAYYDNPESYVPGYSEVATKVMAATQKVFFANAQLVDRFPEVEGIGLGYSPAVQEAEIIAQQRASAPPTDVWGYFGGNNETYFTKALPALIELLKQGIVKELYFQEHPGAKGKDRKMIEEAALPCTIHFGKVDPAKVAGMMYYQTSMAYPYALAGVPLIQVGHEPFSDLLVRNDLIPSVTKGDEWAPALQRAQTPISREKILEGLGLKDDWWEIFKQSL